MSGEPRATPEPPTRTARRRRRAGTRRWLVRSAALLVLLVAWLAVGGVGGPDVGRLSQVQENDDANFLPSDAEATELSRLSQRFSQDDALPYLVVVERASGITAADRTAVQAFVSGLPSRKVVVEGVAAGAQPDLREFLLPAPAPLVPSEDGKALLVPVSADGDRAGDSLSDGSSVALGVATAIRTADAQLERSGLQVWVTGPGGVTADFVTAFSGIDTKLLGVTLVAVFVILLLVYRSPVLPFAALLTAIMGLSAAAAVIYRLARDDVIDLDGQSQGILSILVIGAATDYALLLVSRYREELHDHESKYVAMRRAWRRAVEPIAASAATVVLGLLCLLLSRLGSTRGLGPVGAIGITGALLAALTLLPVLLLWPVVIVGLVAAGVGFALGSVLLGPVAGAVLAALVVLAVVALGALRHRALQAPAADAAAATGRVARLGRLAARAPSGRWLFWPRVPGLDHVHQEDQVASGGGLWGRVARLVGGHPRLVWTTVLVVLLGAACFAPTLQADGISQTDVFRGRVESVDGSKVLARHFPGGSGSPALLVVPEADAADAQRVVEAVPGISSVAFTSSPGTGGRLRPRVVVDGQVQLEATLAPAADSTAGEEVVQRLRTAVDAVGQDVLVGGPTAVQLDVRDASDRDLRVIVPAVLVVILLVLMLLLRAVVAPVLLVLANVLSFAATLGVSALVFDHVFGFPGGDPSIPLYAFVFLVALGIDYSIFLMTRVREEAGHRGPRPGVLVGLAVTGGVITSAGVVLSATFGALGSVPILFLQQVAFIVAFGVLLDTLVVRSLLVPALAHDLGRAAWWPGRLSRVPAVEQPAPVEAATAGEHHPEHL
ncbi:MMPL family transporter [Angustibacter aerolatus]